MADQPSSAFISYCRDDQEFALRLAQDLKDAGAAVWLDQLDIKPGHAWDNAVEGALRAAAKMLVILTPTSVSSENVRDEIAYALKQGKIVIPVLYMECEIPLRLERKQHIDFRSNYARGLELLLRELRVDHPSKAVLERAAEGDVQRKLAWQAREAETQRRLDEQAEQEQARQAHEETLRREQEPEQQAAPAQPRVVVPRPQEAEPRSDVKAAAFQPWFWRRSSWTGLAGGFAAILIVGFVFFRPSSSSHPKTASQPQPVVAQPTPQPANPQPSVAAPEGNPGPVVLAKQGATLFSSKRYAEALPLLTQACDGGEPHPCNTLGFMYRFHLGVPQDYGKAFTLFTKACDGGDLDGCANLGFSYSDGKGVAKDYGKANTFFTKACDGGDPDSCNGLGDLYNEGKGVPKDYGKASTFYTKACDGGDADGCNELGVLYDGGRGVAQDYGKAFALCTKACNLGSPQGCSNVGNLYRLGHGVAMNLDLARQYLKKGCNMGNTWGCDRLKEMK